MVNFKVKRVFKRSKSSFPELKLSRASRKYLESGDFYGDSMVFKIEKRAKSSRKFRDSESDSPAAPSVHFEGQFGSLNGSPHLDDAACPHSQHQDEVSHSMSQTVLQNEHLVQQENHSLNP